MWSPEPTSSDLKEKMVRIHNRICYAFAVDLHEILCSVKFEIKQHSKKYYLAYIN